MIGVWASPSSRCARASPNPRSPDVVGTLVRQRYLERDGKRIHLGLRVFELGQLAEQPRELRTAALPVMADLRNETGQNVHLAIRDGREMVCIAVMRGRSAPHRRVFAPADGCPIHATALGKAALAHLAPPTSTRSSRGLEAWTPQTISDPSALAGVSSTTSAAASSRGGGGVHRGMSVRGRGRLAARRRLVAAPLGVGARGRRRLQTGSKPPIRAAARRSGVASRHAVRA